MSPRVPSTAAMLPHRSKKARHPIAAMRRGKIVCNLASGHYTSFPTNELTSSRAVFVQPLGACCYRNK
eukprot:scaffold11072_cov99-Skeletonema_dohrnii-CCMP3373.AAC.9